jgi:tetratricopeptide (TPR) repeat protein
MAAVFQHPSGMPVIADKYTQIILSHKEEFPVFHNSAKKGIVSKISLLSNSCCAAIYTVLFYRVYAKIVTFGICTSNRGSNMDKKIVALCLAVCALFVFESAGESAEESMTQGNMLLQNGAYDQAVNQFRKVVNRDPSNFEAQFNLGFAYLNWGRLPAAITEFQNALKINSRCGECWSNIAMAYEKQGQSQKALDALHYSVQMNPNNIPARVNLATMYANYNRLAEAIAQYKQIIQIDGRNVDAHINLAKCLISQGNTQEAKTYLKSALSINPDDAEAYYELGNIAWKKEKSNKEAIDLYKKAIAIQPTSQVYYENLALIYEELNELEDAAATWKNYLIYLDDALKKVEIEDRIAMIEDGENPSDKRAGRQTSGGMEPLKADKRQIEGSSGQILTTGNTDALDDLRDLDKNKGRFEDFDMDKAIKKKKEQNQ